jgi:lipopolysaccharide transport protein LptA
MARSLPDLRLCAAALLLAALAAVSPAGAQVALDPSLPISLDADTSDFDRRRNRVEFTRLRISQGPLQIRADRGVARQIDFEDAIWEFSGNVVIDLDEGQLRADQATLTFADFRLTRAVATGAPAEFEDTGSMSGRPVRGRSGRMEYDLVDGIIRLSDGAWLAEGANEITGSTLVYNVPEERVLADGEGDRVRITIQPPERGGGAGTATGEAQGPEPQEPEAQEPEAQEPEAQEPEAQEPEAQEPGPQEPGP